MFIRWKSRTKQWWPGRADPDTRWSAILVESVRVDGKPRLRHLAFLGSITDQQIQAGQGDIRFWRSVYRALDDLGDRLTAKDRERIVAELADRVPRLTGAQVERREREFAGELAAAFK
jgi:hypothetical protein